MHAFFSSGFSRSVFAIKQYNYFSSIIFLIYERALRNDDDDWKIYVIILRVSRLISRQSHDSRDTMTGLLPRREKLETLSHERKIERKETGNGEARRAGDRVVGPTKLLGSTTDTFLGSNHQDTMTTRSLASSSTRRPSAIGPIIALLLIAVARKSQWTPFWL